MTISLLCFSLGSLEFILIKSIFSRNGKKKREVKDGSLGFNAFIWNRRRRWKDEFKNTRARIRETIKSRVYHGRGGEWSAGGRWSAYIGGEFVNDAVALTNGPVQQRPIRPREKSDGVHARARARSLARSLARSSVGLNRTWFKVDDDAPRDLVSVAYVCVCVCLCAHIHTCARVAYGRNKSGSDGRGCSRCFVPR